MSLDHVGCFSYIFVRGWDVVFGDPSQAKLYGRLSQLFSLVGTLVYGHDFHSFITVPESLSLFHAFIFRLFLFKFLFLLDVGSKSNNHIGPDFIIFIICTEECFKFCTKVYTAKSLSWVQQLFFICLICVCCCFLLCGIWHWLEQLYVRDVCRPQSVFHWHPTPGVPVLMQRPICWPLSFWAKSFKIRPFSPIA